MSDGSCGRYVLALEAIRDFYWDEPIAPQETPTTKRMREIATLALEVSDCDHTNHLWFEECPE